MSSISGLRITRTSRAGSRRFRATAAINPLVKHGPLSQLGIQAIGVSATILFAAVGTFILYKVVDAVMGMRVLPEAEEVGLDLSQHGETAYNMVA